MHDPSLNLPRTAQWRQAAIMGDAKCHQGTHTSQEGISREYFSFLDVYEAWVVTHLPNDSPGQLVHWLNKGRRLIQPSALASLPKGHSQLVGRTGRRAETSLDFLWRISNKQPCRSLLVSQGSLTRGTNMHVC